MGHNQTVVTGKKSVLGCRASIVGQTNRRLTIRLQGTQKGGRKNWLPNVRFRLRPPFCAPEAARYLAESSDVADESRQRPNEGNFFTSCAAFSHERNLAHAGICFYSFISRIKIRIKINPLIITTYKYLFLFALIRNREDTGVFCFTLKTKLVPIYNPAYCLSRVYERRISGLSL